MHETFAGRPSNPCSRSSRCWGARERGGTGTTELGQRLARERGQGAGPGSGATDRARERRRRAAPDGEGREGPRAARDWSWGGIGQQRQKRTGHRRDRALGKLPHRKKEEERRGMGGGSTAVRTLGVESWGSNPGGRTLG